MTQLNQEFVSSPPDEAPFDAAAAHALLYSLSPRLLDYLHRHVPPELRAVVEPYDVLQDTFFEAFQRVSTFIPYGEDAPFRWLVTIARNRIATLVRINRCYKRGSGRRSANAMDEFGSVISLLEEYARYERTPSQSAMSHEVTAAIQGSLGRLAPQYREAVRLRFVDGLSIKDTADRLQRSEGAITMLCNRGLRALKAEMRSASLFV